MELNNQNNEPELIDNEMDIKYDKPSTSRLFFLIGFFGFFVFSWAGCFNLYQHKHKNNNDVKVPESTLYDPKYK
jgi:hypothetical protein